MIKTVTVNILNASFLSMAVLLFIYLFIYLFFAALGLHCGARASVVVARGLSSCGSWALEYRLSSCGARA